MTGHQYLTEAISRLMKQAKECETKEGLKALWTFYDELVDLQCDAIKDTGVAIRSDKPADMRDPDCEVDPDKFGSMTDEQKKCLERIKTL